MADSSHIVMEMPTPSWLAASTTVSWLAVSTAIFVLLSKLYTFAMRPKDYPPGPPTTPVVGNLLQMPTIDTHLTFEKWAKQYGEIFSIKFGATNMIFLNSRAAIKELMEKRSGNYACRPNIFYRWYTKGSIFVVRDNDDVWRRARKSYHFRLNAKASDTYVPYQEFESLLLMNHLLADPGNFSTHLSTYTTSVASTLLYGLRSTSNDETVANLKKWMTMQIEAQKPQLIDLYPVFRPLYRLLPARLDSYKTLLNEIDRLELPTLLNLVQKTKDKLASGKVSPSFVSDLLSLDGTDKMSDEEIARTAGTGFGAATDTTWGTSRGFVKAMVLYPSVLKAAQEEMDRVVGPDRLPTWSDRAQLPYMRAVIEESLRWAPVGFTAVPHAAARADKYGDYTIPAGAIVNINVWVLNNADCEKDESDPRDFDPTRFTPEETLVEQNSITADSMRRRHFTFGAGRRVCPGVHVAQRGMFVGLARLVWGFNFAKKRDADGREINIDRDAFNNMLAAQVLEFECEITPRDEKRAEIMRREWADAQVHLDVDGNFTNEFFQKVFEGTKK